MLVRFTKGPPAAEADTLTCVRPDGSASAQPIARQGILPHHAFHFVIECTLEWRDAFFGQIARGGALDEVHARLHGQSGGWSKTKLTQGLQTEALIECLEAEQWAGAADPAAFAENLVACCRRRSVPPPDVTPEELDHVRTALREFGAAWRPLAAGGSIERTF